MKIKFLLFCAVLSAALTTATFAKNNPATNVKNIINEFAESHVNTDVNQLSRILSGDAIIKFTRGNEVLSQSHISIMKIEEASII